MSIEKEKKRLSDILDSEIHDNELTFNEIIVCRCIKRYIDDRFDLLEKSLKEEIKAARGSNWTTLNNP